VTSIRHPEFIESLENTNYPFVPTAALSNGEDSFLEGTFLDAHLYAPAGASRYYLSQVDVTAAAITLTIGDSADVARLTGVVTLPLTDNIVRLTDQHNRPGGLLVSEASRLSLLAAWGVGEHRFTRNQTEFCVTCQVPVSNPGVTGIRLASGEILTGKIWLVGEDGVILSTENATTSSGEVVEMIRTDVVGDPLFLQRLCNPEDLFNPLNPIRIIRIVNDTYTYDCEPDEHGNFNVQMNDSLAADAALRIRTTPEGIVVTVEGSTPEGL
jgi:hypothetical protein